VNDSIVFDNVPYGTYNGSAWMYGEDPVYAESVIGQNNHLMTFVFDLTGYSDLVGHTANLLSVRPNPFRDNVSVEFTLEKASAASLKIYSLQGVLVKSLSDGMMNEGKHTFTWDGSDLNGVAVSHGLYMIMLQTSDNSECIGIVRN
jgi:hypothetical protein